MSQTDECEELQLSEIPTEKDIFTPLKYTPPTHTHTHIANDVQNI